MDWELSIFFCLSLSVLTHVYLPSLSFEILSGSGLLSCSVVPSPELLFSPRSCSSKSHYTERKRKRGREWVRESNKYRVCFLIQTSGRIEKRETRGERNFVPHLTLSEEKSLPHPYPLFPALPFLLISCADAVLLLPIDHLIPFSNRNRGTFARERGVSFHPSAKPWSLWAAVWNEWRWWWWLWRYRPQILPASIPSSVIQLIITRWGITADLRNQWEKVIECYSWGLQLWWKEGYIKHLFPSRFLISGCEAWIEKQSISSYINLSLHHLIHPFLPPLILSFTLIPFNNHNFNLLSSMCSPDVTSGHALHPFPLK